LRLRTGASEEQEVPALFEGGLELACDLVAGLGLHRELAIGAVDRAESTEEEAEELVDFGDCGDGAFAPATGVALFDADGGRQAGDAIDSGSRHLFDELTRIAVHGIEEPTLAFGEEKVEGEGAFS
jgi:hypothetical protein